MVLAERPIAKPRRWPAAVAVLIGLLYGVWPVDLIPDLIPLLGWSDDGAVMLTAAVMAWRFLRTKRRKPLVRPTRG